MGKGRSLICQQVGRGGVAAYRNLVVRIGREPGRRCIVQLNQLCCALRAAICGKAHETWIKQLGKVPLTLFQCEHGCIGWSGEMIAATLIVAEEE